MLSETNWFFKLSSFVKPLPDLYRNYPEASEPESARNEVISFLEGEVLDLSISRSTFDWGIPVPWDTKQVVYVWFDALLNYATAVGLTDEPASEGGKFFCKDVACGCTSCRQRHSPFPCRDLAGHVDGCRTSHSEEDICSWMVTRRRREDE